MATWRERWFMVSMTYRMVYALAWGVAMLIGAFQWGATEAGLRRGAEIGLGVSIVIGIVILFAVLMRTAAVHERKRKKDELERRWQERPAAHRQVHRPGPGRPAGLDHPSSPHLPNSPDVAP